MGRPGSKQWQAKLTEADVVKIRALRQHGMTYAALAKQFHVHPSTITQVVNRYSWRHVT